MTPPDRDPETEQAIAESAHALFGETKPSQPDQGARDVLRALGNAGFIGLGIAEDAGGSGGSARLAGLVAEVAGAHAAAIVYLPQLLAAHAAAGAGDRELTESLVAGTVTAAIFFDDGAGNAFPSPTALDAAGKVFVQHNRYPRRLAASVLSRRDDVTWLGPDWHDLRIEGDMASAVEAVAEWRDGLALSHGISAMAIIGLAQGLLDRTTVHVNARVQFGAPIGSFQAIKHALADVYIDIVHTRALVLGALDALDGDDPDAAHLLSLAKVAADGTADRPRRCLQAMGGIGFTWESDVHRYLKQALRLRQWPLPHLTLRASVRPTSLTANR
jgi:alkylation response protein AidB-like acyl-CoA dehydrogenase